MITGLGWVMVVAGLAFILTGIVGVLRLPDFYSRLHAVGKSDTLGVALTGLGVALLDGHPENAARIVIIVIFVWLANPTATHALGRAAYRAGLEPWTGVAVRDGGEDAR